MNAVAAWVPGLGPLESAIMTMIWDADQSLSVGWCASAWTTRAAEIRRALNRYLTLRPSYATLLRNTDMLQACVATVLRRFIALQRLQAIARSHYGRLNTPRGIPGETVLDRVGEVDTALVVACIAGGVALVSATFSGWTQLQVTKREREGRAEERRSQAKVVLDRYRGPLLDAAWQLGSRVDNIRNRDFFAYLSEGSGREKDAKLTTLFRFAHYLGWREFIRTEVQLLRFENEEDTRSAAEFLNEVTWVLASDKLDGIWAMLWGDEQRGIGELMADRTSGTSPIVRGHAAFHDEYDKVFAPWMERFADDLFSALAINSCRLRLLQWALYGLVRQLDDEDAYSRGWIDRSAAEIRQPALEGSITEHEEELRRRLAAISNC